MKLKIIPLAAALLMLFSSCAKSEKKSTAFTDSENRLQITAGEEWCNMTGSLMKNANIEIGNSDAHKYFIVILDEKSRSQYEFEEYAELTKSEFISKLDEDISAEFNKTVINDKDSLQAEITSTSKNDKITYIMTIIDTDEHFITACGWYRTEMKRLNHADILSVTKSIKFSGK